MDGVLSVSTSRGKGRRRRIGRLTSVLVVMSLVLTQIVFAPLAFGADEAGGGATAWPQYVLNDHTAYAIQFSMTGLPLSTTLNVNVRLSKTGIAGGFTDARGFTWNPSLGRWVHTREAAANFPPIVTDASGNASGWVYWKCGDENFTGFGTGFPPLGANQAYLTVSLQTPTGGGTYNGLDTKIVTILDTKTEGAWIHNGVATGAAAAKRADALKSDDALVQYSVQKTEANVLDDEANGTVDDEDYGPTGATGDFRFGVPAGTSLDVKLNQANWAPGQDVAAGPADTDVAIGASEQVPPTAPSGLTATARNARVILNWSASTDSGSGLSGYAIYRLIPGTYGTLTLQSDLPRKVGTVAAGTTTFSDTGLTNGQSYSYYVRAIDAATNVSARSNTAAATPVEMPDFAGTMVINDGAGYTTVPGVTLTSAVLGATQMRFSNDGVFDDPVTEAWTAYAASAPWTLAAGTGLKTVYAEYTDGIDTFATSDTILFDSLARGASIHVTADVPMPTPMLNFTVSPGAAPTGGSVTDSTLDFGMLSPTTPKTGSHYLSVSTNAAGGYLVTAGESGPLSSGTDIIPDVVGDDGSITHLLAGPWALSNTYGFGYTVANRVGSDAAFSSGFKQFADASASEVAQTVMTAAAPVEAHEIELTYKVNVSAYVQPMGAYATTVTYLATGNF